MSYIETLLRALRRTAEGERRKIEAHNERMAHGCRLCASAVPGRVCPDCYVCIACTRGGHDSGCEECRRLRIN